MGVSKYCGMLCAAFSMLATAPVYADGEVGGDPVFQADGSVMVPSFKLPASDFMSDEAKARQADRADQPNMAAIDAPRPEIGVLRKMVDAISMPKVKAMQALYPVTMTEETIDGVRVRSFVPAGANFDPERLLINLHGGGFMLCWDSCSQIESIPIASLSGYKVVSIDYPMAPEAQLGDAMASIAKVYRALLKDYRADRIGIYGCSAGGALTASSSAWFATHDLPQPGALGIFGSGAVRDRLGDSDYFAAYVDGAMPRPGQTIPETEIGRRYFADLGAEGEIASPALHPEILAQFPPTMLITGTRAGDLSAVAFTNSQLLKAGVDTRLIVGEAMGHCYINDPDLPEARDANEATVAFFREHLE